MDQQEYENWKEVLQSKFPENSSIHSYLDSFRESSFPIIFGLGHLSVLTRIDGQVLARMVNESGRFYRQFSIPKRNGSGRTISSPYPALKAVQRWILDEVLKKVALNSAATGFVNGKTLVDNVSPHLGKQSFLKIDLKDFFSSIVLKRVWAVFRRCGYSKKVSYYLASLCCLDGSLPQGSPASPALTNIICRRLDARLHGLAIRFDLTYTRYADDVALTGNRIPPRMLEYVVQIVESEKLMVNRDKTRIVSGKGSKVLTGISIRGTQPMLPRSTKRLYRSESFNILKLSTEEYCQKVFPSDPVAIERTIGKFTFWKFVEPHNKYVETTLQRLKEYSSQLYRGEVHPSNI